MKYPVYLDNHSTTKIDKAVLDAMLPYLTELYGNASSKSHPYGWIAEQAVENARETISGFLKCSPEEIIFTSGTTEANHIAISGILGNLNGKHVITSVTEHSSVLNLLRHFEKNGVGVTYLPVDQFGSIDIDQLIDSITNETILVSIMTANNEIGTINPVDKIGEICRSRGVIFHTDAAQAIGKVQIDLANIDLLSFSAHKNYGPKGIGALYKKKTFKLKPVYFGGGQEKGIRPGTLNVAGIVGMGKCIEIYRNTDKEESDHLRILRDKLYNGILSEVDTIKLNGHPENRLPNNLNLSFPDVVNMENFLMELRELAFSTGAACASGEAEPSHVLKAIGLDDTLIKNSLRFGVGRYTTEEEIDFAIDKIVTAVKKLKKSYIL